MRTAMSFVRIREHAFPQRYDEMVKLHFGLTRPARSKLGRSEALVGCRIVEKNRGECRCHTDWLDNRGPWQSSIG